MISEKRRKELEASGKVKSGNVVVLKKGKEPQKPKVNEVAEIAKKMDATFESAQKQNLQMFEKLSESLDAIRKQKIDIPRDEELTEIVKKLPEIIKEINDTTNKRYASLFKELIKIIKTEKPVATESMEKPKKLVFTVETRDKNRDLKTVVAESVEV